MTKTTLRGEIHVALVGELHRNGSSAVPTIERPHNRYPRVRTGADANGVGVTTC
jgi:hypothetical protein